MKYKVGDKCIIGGEINEDVLLVETLQDGLSTIFTITNVIENMVELDNKYMVNKDSIYEILN